MCVFFIKLTAVGNYSLMLQETFEKLSQLSSLLKFACQMSPKAHVLQAWSLLWDYWKVVVLLGGRT